jgi:hypothetical protein
MQQGPPWEHSSDPTGHENSPHIVKTEVSLPCPQVRAICHSPELDQSSPRPTILFVEDFFFLNIA